MANNDPGNETPRGSLPVPKSRRGGAKGFLLDVSREMKKVSWPTRTETNRLTGVVLAVCLMGIIILTVMSMSFEAMVSIITRGGIR
jgi:preprotein translocase SecE subunit